MSKKTMSNTSIITKEYNWSWYVFLVDIFIYSVTSALIFTMMLMHRATQTSISFENSLFYAIVLPIETFFIFISYLDARKKIHKERFFGGSIFNLFAIVFCVFIAIAIFWGEATQNAIVYGTLSGGFAGYLAGGLAYADFFIKIKDEIYRILFGGIIGVLLGGILGGLFAGLVDPIGGDIFGGIFMGFWGGVISGGIATVLLYILREERKFTDFFSKRIMYLEIINKLTKDIESYFEKKSPQTNTLNLEDCSFYNVKEVNHSKFVKILLKIIYFINPWAEINSEKLQKSYNEIFDYVLEELPYQREEFLIKKKN
ncbi:MAG: hypothetical protein U9O98_09190 [Asgard group archaeon]|nr:hypothetical protein [Asgard group archaeon]